MSEEKADRLQVGVSAGNVCKRDEPRPTPDEIRQELDRILASPPFRNSKRYSALLHYLVESTLAGRADELKERSIGVDVFDRKPNYDTATDHVVRSSGTEVRKRLAQYYQETGQQSRVRFDLYPGSYVPQFRLLSAEPEVAERHEALGSPESPAVPVRTARPWPAFLAFFGTGAGLVLGILSLHSWESETALDRFWKPVTDQPGSIILSVGPDRRIFGGAAGLPAASTPQTAAPTTAAASPAAPIDRARQVVVGDDAITLARVAAELARRDKDFRIFLGSSATLEDIRERPSVLIGTRNNEAALEILNSTRFQIVTPGAGVGSYISDTDKGSGGKTWMPTPGALRGEYVRDYALVVRCMHPKAGKIVVVCGGVHAPGNFAAGDFLTNEKLMSQLDSLAPAGWARKNVAVVLATDVVKGVAGVPSIEATHFW